MRRRTARGGGETGGGEWVNRKDASHYAEAKQGAGAGRGSGKGVGGMQEMHQTG